ncbi:hypothetical protein MKI84_02990 [Ancylobacter sp. A5.8]|uniref:hypothetical protein n=1 Tax=Ancylobacter gelatini TaxID=2919920 RepID=UPI001F4E8FE7|nr:hypothetical protein [Ancylobacter gelatini]MCJ8141871.1 hypothetical protein [Ancylobacter gelatini]
MIHCLQRIVLGVVLLMAAGPADAASVRQVYLVQNSGWMEPYYLDPASQFIALAERLIEATQLEGVDITVATFNQDGQVPGQTSPDILYAGSYNPQAVALQLATITLPRRPNGRYADADFLGALQATLGTLLQQQDGIIWMLSNNKNSPNNSQDVENNTRGFYDLLRGSEFITRIIAFPLRMPVVGPNFSEKGFIVYGIAYGADGARALDVITGPQAPLRALFSDPPIFLKPQEPQTLELRMHPQGVGDDGQIAIENGVVIVSGLDADQDSTVSFVGEIANVAYPKKILTGHVSASWEGPQQAGSVQIDPARVQNIGTGRVSPPLQFTLTVPRIPRPAGMAGLLTTDTVVDGQLSITLNDLNFDLDDTFIEKAAAVFGGGMIGEGQRAFVEKQLPAIFFDFRTVRERVTTIPIRVILSYPVWPLYAGAGMAVAMLLLLAGLLTQALRARAYSVALGGGGAQRVMLRPGQQVSLQGIDGKSYLLRGRLFGPPRSRVS